MNTNKVINRVLFIIVAIALVYAFMKSGKKHAETPVAPVATTTDVVISTSTDFYTLSATYPVEPRDMTQVMKTNVMNAVTQKEEEWKTGGGLYNDEKKLQQQFPDRPVMRYELKISYTATTSTRLHSTSYMFQNYEFTGGAHGNSGITTYTFGDKGLIAIEDILNLATKGNDLALTKLVESKLKVQLADNLNLKMLDDGLGLSFIKPDGSFDSAKCGCDGFLLPSNFQKFSVTDEGITFIYDPYQVAPYVNGDVKVLLTWDELKPYLKPGI